MVASTPPVAPTQTDLTGTRLGSFTLMQRLGEGGMGTVYLGVNAVIGSRVAVKVLHPWMSNDPRLVARFQAEARAANLIHSENVVSIYDFAHEPPDLYYFVMELLEGRPLSSLRRPVELPTLVHVLQQLCDALEAAHSVGVVHRDLKPENVRLVKRGGDVNVVKVLDFGIAKLLHDETPALRTRTGQLMGTPEFMAPEQTTGAPVDARTDLYALGVLAYELATGELPFKATSLVAMLQAHRSATPRDPRTINPELPEWLAKVVLRALEKSPDRRWQSAAELRQAIDAGATPPPSRDRSTPPPLPATIMARVFDARGHFKRLKVTELPVTHAVFESDVVPPPHTALTVELEYQEVAVRVPGVVTRGERDANGHGRFDVELNLTPAQQATIEAFSRGHTAQPDADAVAEVERWAHRRGNPYELLAVSPEAQLGEVQQAVRAALSRLHALVGMPLPLARVRDAERLLSILKEIDKVFASPLSRVMFDATISNWKGVARSLPSLSSDDATRARDAFLETRPHAAEMAYVHARTSAACEARDLHDRAVADLVLALQLDPLNRDYHARLQLLVGTRESATTALLPGGAR